MILGHLVLKNGHLYTYKVLAGLAQMVACLPLVQQVRGSIPGGLVNFLLKILNLGARRGGDVITLSFARLYVTDLDYMLRRHIVLLIEIRPSDEHVKPGFLVLFEKSRP